MDKKSKIFFLVFFLLIAGSVAATYYRYIVARDYIIEAEADCDPYTEACFTYVCDPEAGEECTGDPTEDTSYYKSINRNAKNIPLCDPAEEGCEALVCPPDEEGCEIIFCDPATAEEGTVCTDPAAYTLEHPIEEEVTEEAGIEEESDEEGAADEMEGDVNETVENSASEEMMLQDESNIENIEVGNEGVTAAGE